MVGVVSAAQRAPVTARRMAEAAQRYLESLDEPRRRATQFAFEDQERFRWNYRPDGFFIDGITFWHEGLRLINMTRDQQQAAMALLDSGVSARTADRARQIMALESHLREQERVIPRWVPHVVRDPELYAFSIFGRAGRDSALGLARRRPSHRLPRHRDRRRAGRHDAVLPGLQPVAGSPRHPRPRLAHAARGGGHGSRPAPEPGP